MSVPIKLGDKITIYRRDATWIENKVSVIQTLEDRFQYRSLFGYGFRRLDEEGET